jgi:TPP-dependent 2-oxoacid decarboxylase
MRLRITNCFTALLTLIADRDCFTAVLRCAADLIERYLSPIPESGYNYVQRWDYSLLAQAMCNKGGKYKILKVS